jgi:hypothetical protein
MQFKIFNLFGRIQKKLIIFLVFFVPYAALAGSTVTTGSVVATEFEMLLPRPFQQSLIDENWQTLQREEFKLNWQIVDQTFDTPDVKVLLSGITLDLKTKLKKPAVDPGGGALILKSEGLVADLDIASITVDQFVEREVGGVIGRFRVQAKCDDVHLHMAEGKGVFAMTLSPVFEKSLVKSHLDDVSLDWTADAWTATVLSCSGAEGFEDIVQAEILKQTGNAAKLTQQKASLMNYVQTYLDTKSLDLAKPRVLTGLRPDIQASLAVSEFLGSGDDARLRGELTVNFQKSTSKNNLHLKLSAEGIEGSGNQSAFLKIPEAFIIAVSEEAFAASSWKERVSSNVIPGFAALMKSRLKQFFAWPALLNYAKTDQFRFDLSSRKDLEVSGRNLKYNVRMTLNAKMEAPEGDDYVNFMKFTVPFKSDVALTVNDGKLTAHFSNAGLSLNHEWDETYLNHHPVSRRFLADSITKKVLESVEGLETEYQLPEIPLSGDISLGLRKVQKYQKSTDLLIELK